MTNKLLNKYQVIIVGGGPIGLFLGTCLNRYGISCLILEKRESPNPHSRSIGIHPVSLELFDRLDMADCFVRQGIKIKQGRALSDQGLIGVISFENEPEPFNFILSLPQNETEHILRESLLRHYPDSLIEGAEVTAVNSNADFVTVNFKHREKTYSIQGDYLAGCDGKHSMVRQHACIPFDGKAYPDTYIMGDFADDTGFGTDAIIYLHSEGLIESFPLKNDRRRWVVKTDRYIPHVKRSDIERRLQQRIGHDLSQQPHFMLSSFGVQKLMARSYVKKRMVLAGDAAHVVSPIGGQGMNLGWIDAWELAKTFDQVYAAFPKSSNLLLNRYSRKQQRITRKVMRRAELNTRLGRKSVVPGLRNTVVWLMLNTPLHKRMTQVFTMRNLH